MAVFVSYSEYLTTRQWSITRLEAKERAGWKCQRCYSLGPLEVHHLTYRRVGRERPSDLVVLCETCHLIEHHDPRPQLRLPFDAVH